MNTRQVNETLYQNNAAELGDEALANVIGGSGGCYWEESYHNDCNPCREEWERRCCRRGLLEDLLDNLF
jgi:hypothetical protein